MWKRLTENRIFRIAVLVLLSVAAAVSLWRGIENALTLSQDFQWDATKALALGMDPYEISLSPEQTFSQPLLQEYYAYYEEIGAPQRMEANQFPSLLMLLLPFAFLPPGAARIAWLASNLLCTAGSLWLLRKTVLKEADSFLFALLGLLMIAGTPFRNQLGVGQHTLFSLFFFLLALYLAREERDGLLPGICLAVSFFKYTLTVPLALYFIYRKKWKTFTVSVLVHILGTLFAALWLKESPVAMIVKPLKVSSVLVSEGGLDFGALFGGSPFAFVLAALVMGMLLFLSLRKGTDGKLLMSVLILWSLIILYHRTYDFFVLIMAAGVFFSGDPADEPLGTRQKPVLALYVLLLAAVFFGLRLFDEALPAKIVTGILYYAYTILLTVLCFGTGMKKSRMGETDGNG